MKHYKGLASYRLYMEFGQSFITTINEIIKDIYLDLIDAFNSLQNFCKINQK